MPVSVFIITGNLPPILSKAVLILFSLETKAVLGVGNPNFSNNKAVVNLLSQKLGFSKNLNNFFLLLIKKRRIFFIEKIIDSFLKKLASRENNDWHMLYKMTWSLSPQKKFFISYDASMNINQGYYSSVNKWFLCGF